MKTHQENLQESETHLYEKQQKVYPRQRKTQEHRHQRRKVREWIHTNEWSEEDET